MADALEVVGLDDVEGEEQLGEVIASGAEGGEFAGEGGGVEGGGGDLYVEPATWAFGDEVDFAAVGEVADADAPSATEQVEADEIFKEAGDIGRAIAEQGVTEAKVCGVVFLGDFKVPLASDIPAEELDGEICIGDLAKVAEEGGDGGIAAL